MVPVCAPSCRPSNNDQAVSVTYPKLPKGCHEPKYRPMNLEDIPRVHEIDSLSFSLPWPEKSYHFELTENPSTLALVVEIVPKDCDPVIIGMSVVWIIADEAHIATIAIHPEFRGFGYGKNLLTETLRQSIQRGAHLATLEVRESNQTAQQLYRSFGFIIIGQRSHYYRDNNEDALIMTVEPMGLQYLNWLNRLEI
jgi:[ribosomal protein S18]-alanine N-acetyltransferase